MTKILTPDDISISKTEQKPLSWSLLDMAIEESYQEISQQRDEDPRKIYSSGACEEISRLLEQKLEKYAEKIEIIIGGGWVVTTHEFFLVEIEGEIWVVDPTWQQFLSEPDPGKPKVLKSRLNELEVTLKKFGIQDRELAVWKDALSKRKKLE